MQLRLPLNDDQINNLKIGEKYELSGVIYTARDAAHKRFVERLLKGEQLPIEEKGFAIFYAGPCPPRPGMAIGSIGATTSNRMDSFVEEMLKAGMKVMIGKGSRDPQIAELCKKYKAVYFTVYGGIAALYSKTVKKAEVVCYEELGTEAVRRLEVENFPVIVATDANGNVFHNLCQKTYKRD